MTSAIRSSRSVAIVVDPQYGERTGRLTKLMAVWIVDTPINRAAVEKLWGTREGQPHGAGVTIFKKEDNKSYSESSVAILPALEGHHGAHVQELPYHTVQVVGTQLSPDIQAGFKEWGFEHFEIGPEGFVAKR